MRIGLHDKQLGQPRCHDMHCVRGGSVQRRGDGGMRSVSSRLGDHYRDIRQCEHMHSVCCGSVQCGVDAGVRGVRGRAVPEQRGSISLLDVRCRLDRGFADINRWRELHSVRGGPA